MGEKASHRWLIEWSDQSLDAIQELSSKDRMTVFHSVKHLAKAENLYSVPGVTELKDPKHEDKRRIRAGDYRVIFWLDTGEIVHLEFTYKGTLMIDGVHIHHKGY